MIHRDLRIVFEGGSCHGGSLDHALKLIQVTADAGAWATKFQLFPVNYGDRRNIPLPEAWLPQLINYGRNAGVEVFFSVFGTDEKISYYVDLLHGLGVHRVKFGFDLRLRKRAISTAMATMKEVIVTTGVMDHAALPTPTRNCSKFTVLYAVAESAPKGVDLRTRRAQYPVDTMVDFSCLQLVNGHGQQKFQGFSDHSLGIRQTLQAVQAGAQMIEKHIRLEETPEHIPDAAFAIFPGEAKRLMNEIRSMGGRPRGRPRTKDIVGSAGATGKPEYLIRDAWSGKGCEGANTPFERETGSPPGDPI